MPVRVRECDLDARMGHKRSSLGNALALALVLVLVVPEAARAALASASNALVKGEVTHISLPRSTVVTLQTASHTSTVFWPSATRSNPVPVSVSVCPPATEDTAGETDWTTSGTCMLRPRACLHDPTARASLPSPPSCTFALAAAAALARSPDERHFFVPYPLTGWHAPRLSAQVRDL
jgi:hypothetical protein